MTNSRSAPDSGLAGTPTAETPGGAVESVMRVLDGLDSMPTALHVAAFERVHTALTEALSAIDGV